MNHLVTTFSTLVAFGLLWLTARGAYALTASAPMTLVLAALVVVQWAAAQRALLALKRGGAGKRSWLRGAGYGVLWLVAATITVSFAGAELYKLFTAQSAAEKRFEAERARVQSRAHELSKALELSVQAADQYARHAAQMVRQETKGGGGSCNASRGGGDGDIASFRRQDEASANQRVEQLKPEANAAKKALADAKGLRIGQDVPQLRRDLDRAVNDLNALSGSPMWADLRAFAEAQTAKAKDIRINGAAFTCGDTARELVLKQLERTAAKVTVLQPLTAAQLLDPADGRDMTQATVIRSWAAVLSVLPRGLWQGRDLIDPALRQRYGMRDDAPVLSPDTLPLILAWLLEVVLIALMLLQRQRGDLPQARATVAARLGHFVGNALRARPGLTGAFARAISGPLPVELAQQAPYIDADRLFADDAHAERAATVMPWYRPWGAKELLAIPADGGPAVRAARELWRGGLLKRLASGISTGQLLRDPRLARAMDAGGGAAPDAAWDVFEVTDEHLTRWLLSAPVEARQLIRQAS